MRNFIFGLFIVSFLTACSGGGGPGGGITVEPTIPEPENVCLDLNASNLGLASPCVCNSGYDLNDQGQCEIPGGGTYTYNATYSDYYPQQSQTIACSGSNTTARTITYCLRSDNQFVSTTLCSDFSPTSTVSSKAGSVAVAATNGSLSNGTEYMTCSAGATTGSRDVVCNSNYSRTGTSVANYNCVLASYTATYTSYAPTQAATTACSGEVVTSRSIATCRRNSDNVLVANGFCSDSTPNATVLSKVGTISVSPTNPSLVNGNEYMSCLEGATSGGRAITCNSSYHIEGTALATQNCFANVKTCSPMPTGTTAGTQTWNGSTYNSCVATTCSAGYTLSSGSCVEDTSLASLLFKGKMALQIMADNSLEGWGLNEQSQLGQGDTSNKNAAVTINLGSGKTAKKVYSNGFSTCAILNDDSVKCWGSNTSGQLGVGDTTNRTTPTAVNLGSGFTAKELIVGGLSYCAILNDNSVKCWGKNSQGELGVGSNSNQTSPAAISFGVGRSVKKLIMTKSSSYNTSCAILDDDTLRCWGYNAQGQIGDASTTDRNTPRTISLGTGKTAKSVAFLNSTVSPDSVSTCAILNDDSLSCWGYNAQGKLGVGDTTNKTSPTAVNLGAGRTITKLYNHSLEAACALLDNSTVKCWGDNSVYQLADNTTTDKTSPQAVAFPSSKAVKEVYLGNDNSNCVVHTDLTLSCWGNNVRGQLGLSSSTTSFGTAQAVSLAKTVKKVVSSDYLICLINSDNTVSCSGDNVYGSLGTGSSSTLSTVFADVNLGSGKTAKELVSDNYGTCAVLNDNSVKCWGLNEKGKLGVGNNTSYYNSPQAVVY